MLEQLTSLEAKAIQELGGLTDPAALPEWYRQYLGKKGALTQLVKQVGQAPESQRPQLGKAVNEVKHHLTEKFESHQQHLQDALLNQNIDTDDLDISLPGRPRPIGHLHVTTQTLHKIYSIFQEMGFQIFESPEVETDEYNFQLLNIPEYHPARDMWDTFWVDDQRVMRTHTSPGQIHAMRQYYPHPIRVILPGKCYRFEQITPRSEHQFYQVEGLAIGHQIHMTDLVGVMREFAQKMYGAQRKIRIRGSYFPFTEPSIEIDIDCMLCESKGCRVCKNTGWLEIGGAGMVHPVVLRNGGYSPDEWTGFAFGMGVERQTMLTYAIHDIRYFYSNALPFLQQF